MKIRFFKTQPDLRRWFEKNSDTATEIRIGFYKKSAGKVGLTPAQALDEALCFGWIDGITKSVDETSYTVRFTPRRAASNWSKINTQHIQRLTKAGKMTPRGLKEVERAKSDGRWARAYDSPKSAVVPEDFLKALKKNKKAKAFFDTLNKQNLFSITYRLQNSKKPETRARWIEKMIEMFARGEKFL